MNKYLPKDICNLIEEYTLSPSVCKFFLRGECKRSLCKEHRLKHPHCMLTRVLHWEVGCLARVYCMEGSSANFLSGLDNLRTRMRLYWKRAVSATHWSRSGKTRVKLTIFVWDDYEVELLTLRVV